MASALLLRLVILLHRIAYIKSNLFNCNEPNQCIEQVFTCDPDEDCYIECTSNHSCDRAIFICPSNGYKCKINCNGKNNNGITAGCQQTTFG